MLLTLADVYSKQFTRTEELLATLIDSVQVVSYHVLHAPHLSDPKKELKNVKPPKPFPRPGEQTTRGTTLAELTAIAASSTEEGA